MSNLEKLILEGWEESKKRAHYPCLSKPIIEEETFGGAYFDFADGEIRIGKKHIAEHENAGIDARTIVTGTFDHEIAHYMVYPVNLAI